MATESTVMDLDSRRNCSTCKTRMSSLLHDSHLMCVACHGFECTVPWLNVVRNVKAGQRK